MDELELALDLIKNFDLSQLGYEFVELSERDVIDTHMWIFDFKNHWLGMKLMIRFSMVSGSLEKTSIDAFLKSSTVDRFEMCLWRYVHEHDLPLVDKTWMRSETSLTKFVEAYLLEFQIASDTYLKEFLLDQKWENQIHYKDMV